MVMYDIHTVPVLINYRTNICTKATVVYALLAFITVVSPLLISYKSQGLWIKRVEEHHRAEVKFKHQLLMVVETSSGSLAWSSCQSFNLLIGKLLRTPLIKSTEFDGDNDGILDNLELAIEIPLFSNESVYGVSLVATFDFQLHSFSHLQMESAVVVQHNTGVPTSSLHVFGDLALHQRQPLPPSGHHTLYNFSVLPLDSTSPQDWKLDAFLSKYWQRNLTTCLVNTYRTWQTGDASLYTLKMSVAYPEQKVQYIPGFWYVLKWAWIQYFVVYVIIHYIVQLAKNWIFDNQIVSTWIEYPGKKDH